jgi:hypothetical protein
LAIRQTSNGNSISLTDDEVYTLQIILGTVGCDKEVNSVLTKLDMMSDVELMVEDYDRLEFRQVNGDIGGKVLHDVVIVIN